MVACTVSLTDICTVRVRAYARACMPWTRFVSTADTVLVGQWRCMRTCAYVLFAAEMCLRGKLYIILQPPYHTIPYHASLLQVLTRRRPPSTVAICSEDIYSITTVGLPVYSNICTATAGPLEDCQCTLITVLPQQAHLRMST